MQLVKIEGRFRRVVSVAGGTAQVIVGTRIQRAVAKDRPNPSWKSDVASGDRRKWLKFNDVIEPRAVERGDILETSDWPEGVDANYFDPSDYNPVLKPLLELARGLPGQAGRKEPPRVELETIEADIKREGLAMPTREELDEMVDVLWERPRHERRSTRGNGRSIIPQPKKVEPPPPVQVASTVPPGVNPEQQHPGEPVVQTDPGTNPTADAIDAARIVDDPSDKTDLDRDGNIDQMKATLEGRRDVEIVPSENKDLVDVLVGDKHVAITPAAERPADVPAGHFYAENLKLVLTDSDNNRMSDQAAGLGWPLEFLAGAERNKKGSAGFTLVYMTKNAFDIEKHTKAAITGGGPKKS